VLQNLLKVKTVVLCLAAKTEKVLSITSNYLIFCKHKISGIAYTDAKRG